MRMNHYNYSSYCQRPEEIDLSVYQLPGSPVHSPTGTAAREQHFLQELRNLRSGVQNNGYRDVPIALSPSFNPAPSLPQNVHSLHRTFSDSNVILTPPQHTLRSRDPPQWMANPPPPFSRPQDGYNSLDRATEKGVNTSGRTFFKCASPTPWQSTDNLSREASNREPQQRQRFFSPAPRQENQWRPEQSHWEREPDERERRSRWDTMANRQREQQQSTFEHPRLEQPSMTLEHNVNGESRQSRRNNWEQQPRPRDLSLTRIPNWDREAQEHSRQRNHSLTRNPEWETNPQPSTWANRQGRDWNGSGSRDYRVDSDAQHRQQVQRDLLHEIQQHRQQEAARVQVESDPYRYEHDEGSWRQPHSLAPLFENRTSRRSDWETRPKEDDYHEGAWLRQDDRIDQPRATVQPQMRQDPMSRSHDYGRGGFFAPPQPQANRAMTEPPREMGMLDRAMQNSEQCHSLGPELEMDVTVTHSSYRNGDGKIVATSPQRHSYAGTFSEFSRNQVPAEQYSNRFYNTRSSPDNRPRSLAYEGPSSLVSSPPVSPPNEFSLPASPIQRSVSLQYPTRSSGPIWELDNIYGMAGAAEQRSFMRNGETPQRSTVTTPMYGRGTLNERQPERTAVERTTAVVNPLIVEQPSRQGPKHAGILLNPNETRKSGGSKRRVMFMCDREEPCDDFYGKNFADAPAHVKAYDAAIEDVLGRFTSISEQIGGDVAAVAQKFNRAMDLHRQFLWEAASQPKPADSAFMKLFQPLIDIATEITAFKDSKRQSPHANHLNAVSEGVPALGWVQQPKAPAPYINQGLEAAMFYLNRILKEYKEKDQKHVDWVKCFQEILKELSTFVRQTHTTGLVWNSAPGNVPTGASKPAPAPPAGPSGGPPPPPPPPPANLFDDLPKQAAPSGGDKAGRDALFAQLNKGEGITSGLKKVTSDMQTHKNPNLRTTSTVPSSTSSTSVVSASSPVRTPVAAKKPARVELENGKQWMVENYEGNKTIIVEITDKKQSVYVYKCDNSVVQVKGKCNSVALDSCKKTAIVVDGVVAQCETVNCQSVQIQTMGDMPTLSIQKTDGCQVYLSEASKDCEIVTSKSSEMNVLVPEGPDGEFIELALPEQFKTIYKAGKLVTVVSDI